MSKRKASISTDELANGKGVSSVKKEPSSEVPVVGLEEDAKKVLDLIQKIGAKGISDDDIRQSHPELSAHDRVAIINKLVAAGQVGIFNQKGVLIYKLKDQSESSNQLKGSNVEEKTVYTIIKEAGNKGIWIRDVRNKSNLVLTQLNKVLKSLEGKKMIKSVTSVAASKKKVYMLYELEPDRSITGGAWYSNQDFESEFVDVLNQQCLRFLVMKKEQFSEKLYDYGPLEAQTLVSATAPEILKFISELGISKINLAEEDIRVILETLFYDGKIEKTFLADGTYSYRAVEMLLGPPGFVKVPCGVCPVIKNCSNIGLVKPKTCSYLTDWLKKESEIF